MCEQDNTPIVLIPDDIPTAPRLGCGYTVGAMVQILTNVGLITNKSEELKKISEKINPESSRKLGRQLVDKINRKIPVVYSTDRLKTLSYVWKIKFNETSKIPAFSNYFPEMNHNDFSAYYKSSNLLPIFLMDNEEIEPMQKRMELTAKTIKKRGTPVELIDLRGGSVLEKIVNSIILADWTSYYLAIKNNADPIPVDMQEDIKKELGK